MSDDHDDISLRQSMRLRLQHNPNFFGNLEALKLGKLPAAVLKIIGNTNYEEIACIGYNPDTAVLTAIVRINKSSGYSGGPCSPGSQEFVRFYLDYGDGIWVDHGTGGFNIHDLGFADPLCYAVTLPIKPQKSSCCGDKPVLPVVRAILSWNAVPPANQPDWQPIWGNVVERSIQIEPRNFFQCLVIDQIEKIKIGKIDPDIFAKLTDHVAALPPPQKPAAALSDLIDKEALGDLHLMARSVYPALSTMSGNPSVPLDIGPLQHMLDVGIDIGKIGDLIFAPNFNTDFEEIHCVGLDRNFSTLHGIVQVKHTSGYSGSLCTQGSQEYIAFYLDFGSGWEYQGTASVAVHDVPVPNGGLWYQASLPVNLDPHRAAWCKTGKARIRGVLSWGTPPNPNDPDFVPVWGDREDCAIEIMPWPQGVIPGTTTPAIEAVGRMPVAQIDGAGYAKGWSLGGSFPAYDENLNLSPFGGSITMSGIIANPSNLNLEYRVMVKGPSDAAAKPATQSFGISVTTIIGSSVTFTPQLQTANGDWFTYQPQNSGGVTKNVAENLLYVFNPSEEGLHTVYLEARPAGGVPIQPTSAVTAFMVDNSAPACDVNITSGNCKKFNAGEPLLGTYSMSDKHAGRLTLTVTPQNQAAGATLMIDPVVPAAPAVSGSPFGVSLSLNNGLNTTGGSGTWTLNTAGMQPCGYNIRIDVSDRTIVNSSQLGRHNADIEGFCIE